MRITIVCVGKIKEKFYRDAIAEYEKRLSKYCKFEIIEVADEKTPDKASPTEEEQIKEGLRKLEKEAAAQEKLFREKHQPEEAHRIATQVKELKEAEEIRTSTSILRKY